MSENNQFFKQMTANFVAAELRSKPEATARLGRLKALMKGAVVVGDDNVERRYKFDFDGVLPLTELLDPAWSGPVAPVVMVQVA